MEYDPKDWRSNDQIKTAIYNRHRYRVHSAGNNFATLVNDDKKTIHEMKIEGKEFTKKWYLELLERLDKGEQPEQTKESQYYPLETYRRFAR